MIEEKFIYECKACGNVVELLRKGPGVLICCGKPMEEHVAKEVDTGNEKHKPVFEVKNDVVIVKVGDVPHPMEEKHHIEWIEFRGTDGTVGRKTVIGLEEAKVEFCNLCGKEGRFYSFCNLHGLWKSDYIKVPSGTSDCCK